MNRSVAVLALLLLSTSVDTPCLRAEFPSRTDTRDRVTHEPQNASPYLRRRAGGWEVRSRHFAVFSPHGAAEAERVATTMESAWRDMAQLADNWMTAHRDPHFGIASVNVRVLSSGQVAKNDRPTEIFLGPSLRELSDTSQQRELRRAAGRAFADVAGMDHKLPQWVSDGIVAYVAGERDPGPRSSDRVPHADWARAMIEADDARYAWTLFDAMGQAMAHTGEDAFSSLARQLNLPKWDADWREKPLAGQPVLRSPANLDKESVAIVADMIDLLKLDRRFPAPRVQPVRPRVVGSGLLDKNARQATESDSVWSFRSLEERLTKPTGPQWAMIDARGQLVTSRDREKIASLFRRARERLDPVVVRNSKELRAVLASGRTIAGRLDENPDDPNRPILTIRILENID